MGHTNVAKQQTAADLPIVCQSWYEIVSALPKQGAVTRGTHMFLASHICCVSSGTLRARYCWLPRDVSGVKPTMKKCSRGKGIRFTASFLRSAYQPQRHQDTLWSPAPWSAAQIYVAATVNKRSHNPLSTPCSPQILELSSPAWTGKPRGPLLQGRTRVELTREAQAAGDARHDGGDEVVQVAEGGVGQLQRPEADVVQRLVVQQLRGLEARISACK